MHQPSTSTNAGPGNGLTLTLSPNTADLTNSPGVGEGSRNATLCRYAGVHIARGESVEQTEPKALAWAAKCNPPLPQSKALDTVRRLWAKHQAKQKGSTETRRPTCWTGDGEGGIEFGPALWRLNPWNCFPPSPA